MNYWQMLFTLVGGLGMFFYGMHVLSESLQGIAGEVMRKTINWLTTNRVIAVFVGLIVTMFVQSSSITTVMVVGFVNAGLMNLTQAIGVIFGANIGTTITGWIISIKIGKYGLPLLGIGVLGYLFIKHDRLKMVGRLFFALGLVFYGLQNMSNAFKPLRTNHDFISYLSYFSADSLMSVLACVLIGAMLTMVVQSSSAMLGITIALANTNVITFQTAAALVMGENIGTTITAILASLGTNVNARRAATGHAIFNVLGVVVMVIIFQPYIHFIEWLVPGDANFVDALGDRPNVAKHIAMVHTIFNVSASILFLPFLNHLAKLVTAIIPNPEEKQPHKLSDLGNVGKQSPSLAIEQAYQEILKMSGMVHEAMTKTKTYLFDDTPDKALAEKVQKIEGIADNIQLETVLFLGSVMEAKLSPEQTKQVKGLIRISDELESVSDYCNNLVRYKDRLLKDNLSLGKSSKTELDPYITKIQQLFDDVVEHLKNPVLNNHEKLKEQINELSGMADDIKISYIERIEEKDYPPLKVLTYSDIVVALRRIKNHTENLVEALMYSSL